MPKLPKNFDKSALRRARQTLVGSQLSETEESTDSDISEEYAHVPLKTNVPFLDTLNLNGTDSVTMDQLNAQLQQILINIQNISERQQQQDQLVHALNMRIDSTEACSVSDATPTPRQNFENLFRIPDPIKSLPTYDGNRRQLSAWISTAKNTLEAFKAHVTEVQFNMYTTAVLNKIEGKAKDILCLAGNPQHFDDVADILTNAIGDRQELSTYKCQLWQNKMNENTSIHRYFQRTKELVQNIKILAKQNPKYQQSWDAIGCFIDEDALAAFIAGLRDPYFGHVQAARPRDIEDAYAFLCKFRSQQITASRTEKQDTRSDTKSFTKNRKPFQKTENQTTENINNSGGNDRERPKNFPIDKMEVDPSIRSRLTLNTKKYVHNNEVFNDSSETESDNENEVNFCQANQTAQET